MATDKPRLSISMDEETYEKVLAYKEENGIATQSKAIIKIMEMGLYDMEREIAQKNSPSTAEAALGEDVQKMLEILDESLVQMGYITAGNDLTEQQQEVLLGICGILRATFKKK